MGKRVQVNHGAYKGYRGIVMAASERIVKLELEATEKTVVNRGDLDQGTTKSADIMHVGGTGVWNGGMTPGREQYGRTPMHGGTTPGREGMTPGREQFGTTPGREAFGMTPGREQLGSAQAMGGAENQDAPRRMGAASDGREGARSRATV